MLFQTQIQNHAQQIALRDAWQSRTWQELTSKVLALRHFLLAEKNLQENEHIALLIGNRVEFFEAILAGIVSGLWITPINTHLSKAECQYILEDCDAKIVFYDNENEYLLEGISSCETINIENLSASLNLNHELAPPLPANAKAGGTMLYTSGTTGKPKGVRRNKPDLLSDALEKMAQGALSFGLEGKGPHLITGPLYHAAPMLFALYDMLNGAPVIIMPKWDTQNFLDLVERYQVHTSHLVPTMFVRLLHLHEEKPIPNRKINSLKLVLHGAAPVAPSTKHKMIAWWGPILSEYWGASEAGTTTLVNSKDWLNHPGTVGKALGHLKVFVGDKEGNPLPKKENKYEPLNGLLFCYNKNLAQVFEYHKDKEKTLKAHPKPHTFYIGDIGYVDNDGYVYLSDRESNMIISGGVNIYPAEIEQAIIEHPAIADVVVFGIPNEEWGETVKALIELKKGFTASEDLILNIQSYAVDKIAKYKIPRVIEFIESLPRNAAGKVPIKELKKN